jgi:hypothetical protein
MEVPRQSTLYPYPPRETAICESVVDAAVDVMRRRKWVAVDICPTSQRGLRMPNGEKSQMYW